MSLWILLVGLAGFIGLIVTDHPDLNPHLLLRRYRLLTYLLLMSLTLTLSLGSKVRQVNRDLRALILQTCQ